MREGKKKRLGTDQRSPSRSSSRACICLRRGGRVCARTSRSLSRWMAVGKRSDKGNKRVMWSLGKQATRRNCHTHSPSKDVGWDDCVEKPSEKEREERGWADGGATGAEGREMGRCGGKVIGDGDLRLQDEKRGDIKTRLGSRRKRTVVGREQAWRWRSKAEEGRPRGRGEVDEGRGNVGVLRRDAVRPHTRTSAVWCFV
jgi:hypothetical protein